MSQVKRQAQAPDPALSLLRNQDPELRESHRSPTPQRSTDERDGNTNDELSGLQYDLDDADSDLESDHDVIWLLYDCLSNTSIVIERLILIFDKYRQAYPVMTYRT